MTGAGQGEEPAGGAARAAVVEELRALGLLALDRLDPLVDRLTEAVSPAPEPAAQDPAGSTASGPAGTPEHRCTSCPVCVAFADVRTGHPDALAQVARHAAGLMTALRAVLADGADGPEPAPSRPERVVQHIAVERGPSC